MLRFGTIGTGWITRSMIEGAHRYPALLRHTAVCSRDASRGAAFAREVCPEDPPAVFTDPSALARSDAIDMVYIASPNVCHTAQARLFLQNGKHVLCEKPLSADPAEVAALQALAAQRGLLFREAIMLLYQPQLAVLAQAVAACGQIRTARFQFCQLSSKYEAYCRGEVPNIFSPAMHTGALMDLGVYCVYPAVRLFGEPQRVQAMSSFLRTGADGATTALLECGGTLVTVCCDKTAQGFAESEIAGDGGTVTVGQISTLADIRLRRRGEPAQVLSGAEEKSVLMGREIAAFAAAVEQGRTDQNEIDALALSVSRVMETIRRQAGIRFPGEEEGERHG